MGRLVSYIMSPLQGFYEEVNNYEEVCDNSANIRSLQET